MGEFGISDDGPCLAMAYLGIAQTYAGGNLTSDQVLALLPDSRVWDSTYGAKLSAIGAALEMLGVDMSNLEITDRGQRGLNEADSSAFATIRGVPTSASIYNNVHFQEGTNTGAFKWDPLTGTEDDGQTPVELRNIYITERGVE